MKKVFYFLLLLLIPGLGFSQTREADSLILVQVYQTLDGANWNNPENWLSAAPLDDWEGITMLNDRVWLLTLVSQNVNGVFPNEILGLDQLHTFEVRNGVMTGVIPEELVQLTKLNRFAVGGMGLSGDLPDIFDQFEYLDALILSNNNFTGALPDIGDAVSLLYVANNQFSGPIPENWENKNIAALQIHNNNLIGSFEMLSTCKKLSSINVSGNDWNPSTFPEWITTLPNLKRFDGEECNLYGELPTSLDFSGTPLYNGMFLDDNDLSGDISLLLPAEDSEEEIYLTARNNNFSGEFPAHKFRNSFRIEMQNNKYSSLSNFEENVSIEVLNIGSNEFNYESLDPVKEYIALDSIIGVVYDPQPDLLDLDSLLIIEPTTLTLEAGDEHPNTAYQWYQFNTPIEGETNSTLELVIADNTDEGSYRCQMTNSDFPELDLKSNWVRVDVDFTLSTDDSFSKDISVYPNPTYEILFVDVALVNRNYSYQILNSSGKLMLKGLLDIGHGINLKNIPKGMYLLHLSDGEKIGTQKIVKL